MGGVFSRFAAPLDKARDYLPLAGGLALTLVAILVARQRINAVEKTIRDNAAPVDVVVASCPIPKGAALSAQNLAKLAVPSSGTSRRNVPAEEFGLLIGARTKAPIDSGEPIFWTDVEEPFDVEKFSLTIPRGRRALTIEADLTASFAGLIRPGDRVDISLKDTSGRIGPAWLSDIPVVAVDRHYSHPPDVESGTDTSSVTVSVTPEQGRRLAAAPGGSLIWLLRHPDDRTRPPAPSGERTVEIWKAGIREPRSRTAALGMPE
ncbi:MAG: Flp pilus assembly protein CpaB [Gemmatimonadota bacterium]